MRNFSLSDEDHRFLLDCLDLARRASLSAPDLGLMSKDAQSLVQEYTVATVRQIDRLREQLTA